MTPMPCPIQCQTNLFEVNIKVRQALVDFESADIVFEGLALRLRSYRRAYREIMTTLVRDLNNPAGDFNETIELMARVTQIFGPLIQRTQQALAQAANELVIAGNLYLSLRNNRKQTIANCRSCDQQQQ